MRHCSIHAKPTRALHLYWALITLAAGQLSAVHAGTIYYVGTVTNGLETTNWLSPSVVKTFDIYGDNKYGNFCAVNWNEGPSGGTAAGTYSDGTIGFVSGGGEFRQPEYPMVNDILDATQGNTGAGALVNNTPTNSNAGIVLNWNQFVVNEDLTGMVLRVGIMTDMLGPSERPGDGNQGIHIVQVDPTGFSESPVIPCTHTGVQPKMMFFDIVNAQPGDQYSIEVIGGVGDNFSDINTLMGPVSWDTNAISLVSTAPNILTNSGPASCAVGSGYFLEEVAGGAPTPACQWYFGESKIIGATNPVFALQNLTLADGGNYTFVATTPSGSVTSSPIALSVVQSNVNPTLSAYRKAVEAEPSLVSFYTFDNGLLDSVGTNNATFVGTPVVGYGLTQGVGGGLDKSLFLNADGCITLGHVPAFDFTSGNGTLEAWIRADWDPNQAFAGTGDIFSDRDNAVGSVYTVNMPAGKTSIGFWNNSAYNTIPIPYAGTNWHHLAVIFANTNSTNTWTVMWDGQVAGTGVEAVGNSTAVGLTPLVIGGQSVTNDFQEAEHWVGALDEIAIYTNALTPSAVAAHYGAFIAGNPPLIVTQPVGENQLTGTPAELSIDATGYLLSFQWYQNGNILAGATNVSLSISNLTLTNAGTYICVVTNQGGAVTSAPVALAVSSKLPPDITAYEAEVKSEPSLISLYSFTYLNADDSVGTNNGTLENQQLFIPGVGGGPDQALDCLGNSWVDLGSVSDFSFPNQGSVELWFQAGWTNSLSYNPCLFSCRDDNVGDVDYSFHMDGAAKASLGMWNGIAYDTMPLPSLGTNWHCLVITFNSGTWTAYIDANEVGSINQLNNGNPATCQIGSSNPYGTEWWVGALTEVAYYSSTLTASQVQSHYQAFLSAHPPVIEVQPLGGTFLSGATLSLSPDILAENLIYQWYQNGAQISGATNGTFTLPNLTLADNGVYSLVVSNAYGAATSAPVSVTVVASTPSAYVSSVLHEPGLISLYTFAQSNANDSVGTNNGTFITSAMFTAGVGGSATAVYMDGTNGAITFGDVPAFDFPSGVATYELWLRADWDTNAMTYNPEIIANEGPAGFNFDITMFANKSSVQFFGYDVPIPYAGTNWHHLTIVLENPYFTAYWDGQGGTPIRINAFQTEPAEPTQLGGLADGTSVWDGALADVAFYDAALTSAEVAADYQAMLSGGNVNVSLSLTTSGTNLVLSWPSAAAGNWTLQSASELSQTNWISLTTNTPVTIPITNQQQFFRLEKN